MANTYTINSGDTLWGIAKANNTTVDNIMSANPNIKDANKISVGGSLNIPTISPVGALPNNNIINVDSIAKQQGGLNIPQTNSSLDITPTINSAQNTIKNLYDEQLKINQDIVTAQQQKLDPLYQQQLELQSQITGKGAEQLQMEQNAGLTERRQQLSNLNAAIAQQSAKFNAEQYNFSAAGNPTTASVSRKNDAIQLAMMTASAQGIQGNITAAETSINNAIKLKYDDIEQKLQYTKEFIDKNEKIMTESQQKVAADKSAQITSQIAQIQKDKEDMTSLITNALAQGAPTSLTQKAALAKTPLEAAQILGEYSKDYMALQKVKSELGIDITNNSYGNQVVSSTIDMAGLTGKESAPISNILADKNATSSLINAIIKQEGGTPQGTNNPGNIKFVGQVGATKGKAASDGGNFANFNTPQDFQNAMRSTLQNYANQGLSLADAIAKYKGVSLGGGNSVVDGWVTNIRKGNAKLENVPANLKSQVSTALAIPQLADTSDPSVSKLQDNLTKLKGLYNSSVLKSAVGPNAFTRNGVYDVISGKQTDWLASMSNILDNKVLDELVSRKQAGATFGALSEGELNALRNASTELQAKAKRNKDGKIIGFKGTEEAFKTEMLAFQKRLQEAINLATTGSADGHLGAWADTTNTAYNDTTNNTHGYK